MPPQEERGLHTAVWTGTRMIVWGGEGRNDNFGDHLLNTGALYNPMTNAWSTTSTAGAPTARYGHTAVWTGSPPR